MPKPILTCRRIQVDEAWAFCYAKQRNVETAKAPPIGAGDVWTWAAIDADTKLVPSWAIGGRDGETAKAFISDVAKRLVTRVQLKAILSFYYPYRITTHCVERFP